jgi:hypothetical protein
MAQKAIKAEQHTRAADPRSPGDATTLKRPVRRGLLYNRTTDRILILLVPVTWFVYRSWQPVYELRATMPPQFVDVAAAASAAERANEQRLAEAYWDLARTLLRPRYTYGSPLPDRPPEDFELNRSRRAASALASTAAAGQGGRSRNRPSSEARTSAADANLRYWRKLQQMWLEPYAWDAKREWNTRWFTAPIQRLLINFEDYLSNRFRAI